MRLVSFLRWPPPFLVISESLLFFVVILVAVILTISMAFLSRRFIHISTDEVYGGNSNPGSSFSETTAILNPSNPYSATKAAAEMLVKVTIHTSFDIVVVMCEYHTCKDNNNTSLANARPHLHRTLRNTKYVLVLLSSCRPTNNHTVFL